MERGTAHVLVVDDQDSGRFVKTQILRRAGFTVYEAATGLAALDVARTKPIDLVVLDVNLPDISGLDVVRRLRAEEVAPPALQVVHVTSTAVGDADHVLGLNAGADAYLVEPVDAGVLVATVDALLRVRRAEASLAMALVREQRARAEAEKANSVKDEFIATLSHELRTPLNALMGWIWQLRQTEMTESARARALDSLERNTRIQAQLINDLLDVSRIAKGKLQLQMRLVDMARVAEVACESSRAVIERKGVHLSFRAESVCVAGDEGRLQQIVSNLLNNAVQFTPEHGSVSLTVGPEGSDAVIRVQDTGMGIEASLLPTVFEPFRQGKDGLSRAHGGLGLGLAVVQQLVELHDGSVSVASEGVGQGTLFTVRLPASRTPAATLEDAPLLLEGVSVAVVADSPDERESLAAILESSGARVEQRTASQSDPGMTGDGAYEVVIRDEDGALAVASPSDRGAKRPSPPRLIPKPIRPAALVRSIAEMGREQMRSGRS